ncbi:hypothetical protein T07_10488 [Trichinella nelsoni]|uniref:Uncharacterized protein n=1 Tax=Trichinella nelsoni TaxID=6336 RepID=A0A0V0SDQ8_9BILA|nr:hypothetical protein T07_10488 [Trichinella nelsoni]
MHKNRFPALRYANNDRHKRCLIVNMNNEEKEKRKRSKLIADDTKLIADGTKQNKKRQKFYVVRGWKHCVLFGKLTEDQHRTIYPQCKMFQCTKTGFQRCTMQIKIAIKVPYRQLGRTCLFDLRGTWLRRETNKIFDLTFNFLIDMNNEEKEKRKHGKQITDDTKLIADGTKQNKKRQKVYVVPRGSQFCRSGLGILRKGEVIP